MNRNAESIASLIENYRGVWGSRVGYYAMNWLLLSNIPVRSLEQVYPQYWRPQLSTQLLLPDAQQAAVFVQLQKMELSTSFG